MIDLKVPKNKDHIIIDAKAWVNNSSNTLNVYRMSGRDIPTFISKVVEVYPSTQGLKDTVYKEDTVFLSRLASETAQYRLFEIEQGDKKYCSIPIMQVLGRFKDGEISFDSLYMITDKILVKKVEDVYKDNELFYSNDNTMIGEVVKVGKCRFTENWNPYSLRVKVGDKVLIRDNVSTEIILHGDKYYATEEGMVVGIFRGDNYSLNSLTLINESILLKPYISENVLNSNFIIPNLNYEDEDYTEIYNRNLFKVIAIDKKVKELQEDDIILVDRNLTNYVYFKSEKYFITSGIKLIEGKVTENGERND